MISQALSVSWQQNSTKSKASEDFQFQTGNSHTRVKTYVSAGELGGKNYLTMYIVSLLVYNYSIPRNYDELLKLNDYH